MNFPFLLFLTLAFYTYKVEATSFYVSSTNANRNDGNAGTVASLPWATLAKVIDYGYNPGFRPGDTIYIDGTLSGSLFFDLGYSYGSSSQPLRITSLNPNSWSTISSNSDAITIYSQNPPAGMNVVIDNLILVGNTANSGHSGIAVTLWGSSYYSIYGLTVNNVDVSGFTRGGISSYRKPGSGFISNVVITNSAFHDNPGYSGFYGVQGSGIVMAGVQYCSISNVKVYNNGGAVTTSPGPIGTWFFDSDHVTVSDSSFYNNLSQGPDGGGVDFDCGTTNSVFQRVYTWNNWGAGYSVNSCSSGQGYNNDGSSMNIVMQSSTSYGDSYHRKDCLLCIWAATGNTASNILFQDMTLTANGYGKLTVESSYSFYSNQYNTYQMVGLWTYGQVSQIATVNVQFIFDSTTYSADLSCNGFNPTCVATAPTNMPNPAPTNMPIPAPTNMPIPAPTSMPIPAPTNMPIPAPTSMPIPAPTNVPIATPTNKPFAAFLGTNAPIPAPSLSPVAAPVQSSTGGRTFYVSSIQSSASDSNAGTSATSPWKTLAKLTDFAWWSGLRGGDTVYLEGTFNEWIYIDLSLSYGSANSFLRFTSLSSSSPAVINTPNSNNGIALMAYNNNKAGWIQIDNLVIKGSGSTSNNGINIYTQSSIGLDTFYIYNNDISGFHQGIRAARQSATVPPINNLWPYSNKLHNNIDAGLAAVGIANSYIYYCESYSNGNQGFFISDSTNAYLGNDNSHDNKGVGYFVDSASVSVYILNSVSTNNLP